MNFRRRCVGMSDFVLSALPYGCARAFCLGCSLFASWREASDGGGKLLEESLNLPLGIEAFATIDTLDAYILATFTERGTR